MPQRTTHSLGRSWPMLLLALAVTAVGCSGQPTEGEAGGLPGEEIPGAGVTPGGTVDLDAEPTAVVDSGDPGRCAAEPFALTVRSAGGAVQSLSAPAAYAVPVEQGAAWLVVTSDRPLDPARLIQGLPEATDGTLVAVRLNTVGPARAAAIQAGHVYLPPTPTQRPQAVERVADVEVRSGGGAAGPTGGLAGSVTVDAVAGGRLCLTISLTRPSGAQAEGRLAARIVQPPQAVDPP